MGDVTVTLLAEEWEGIAGMLDAYKWEFCCSAGEREIVDELIEPIREAVERQVKA